MNILSNRWLKATLMGVLLSGLNSMVMAANDQPDPTGTWKWTMTGRNDQVMTNTVKLKLQNGKLTGALVGRNDRETPITEGTFKDNLITFKVTRERNGQSSTTVYKGKLAGDTIKGTIQRESADQSREWEAKREASATGTWKWTVTFGDRSFESTLKLKQEGDRLTGAMVRNENETPIEEAKIKDGEISFQVTRERNGEKFVSKYQGKVQGDVIKGAIKSSFGGEERSREWEAKRVKE